MSFPVGSPLEDFYLNIYKRNVTNGQISASLDNDTINSPGDPSQLKRFDFDLYDVKGKSIEEIEIEESITVVLNYTTNELAAQGWDEDSLAIYYYKENTGEWIKLGGEVDKVNSTVTIKANYLHGNYAVFSSKKGDVVKTFEGIRIWPNPFTPGRGGDMYGNLKVSCMFESPVTGFKFVVYDLVGRVIVTKEYMGTYNQCEIYWDGTDDEGYWVKSGVYIFQIEPDSGGYYRGKVGVLR